MRLTTAGESVVLLARRWQDDADRLEAELREMRGEQYGTVRLGAMDSLSNSVLPLLVDTIARDHPRIHLAIDPLPYKSVVGTGRIGPEGGGSSSSIAGK